MSSRYLLWSIFSPSQVILGCLILGSLLLAAGRLRAGRRLTVAAGIGLLVFGFLPTAAYMANPLETRFPRPELPDQITGMILLAGSERAALSQAHGDPQIGRHGGRFVSTLRLADRYPAARIVYSGGPRERAGKGRLETPPAVASAILSEVGLDPGRVSFDESSTDTCEHPRGVRDHVRPAHGEYWIVVTSAIHLPRTMACFRAIGWEVIPYPADYQSGPAGLGLRSLQIADNLALLDLALHEWVGLVYYRLTGRTRELFPAP